MDDVEQAIDALDRGEPVLVYDADGREEEVDMVLPAAATTWQDVATLRTDAGGLVCTAIPGAAASEHDLPFRDELVGEQGVEPYGDRTSFSVTVNHRDTHTGITDRDRATTITAVADLVAGNTDMDAFRSPGHVHLLVSRGLAARQGHTELSVALLRETSHPAAAVVCEMLDADTGTALERADAERYAAEHGLVLLDGATITDRHDRPDPSP